MRHRRQGGLSGKAGQVEKVRGSSPISPPPSGLTRGPLSTQWMWRLPRVEPEGATVFLMASEPIHSPVRTAYDELVARGALTPDPAQVEAARALDRVLADLV